MTAGQLHRQAAGAVLASARSAFTSGVDVVAGVSAVIVAALAVVAVARLRRATPADEGSDSIESDSAPPIPRRDPGAPCLAHNQRME